MNNRDEVVGGSCDGRALLWRRGTQYDLSSLAAPSDVVLTDATWIDNTGRIVSLGTLPNGNQHVFVLTPTGNAFARDGSPRVRVVHGSQTCTYPIRGLLPRKLPADDC
jgi:hypothetical protein